MEGLDNRKPGIYSAGIMISIFLMVSLIVSFIAAMIAVAIGEYTDTLSVVMQALYSFLTMVLPLILYCAICRTDVRETFKVRSVSLLQVFILVLMSFFIMFGATYINSIFSSLITLIKPDYDIPSIFAGKSDIYIVAMSLLVTVAAPLSEEFFMRGFVQSAFDGRSTIVGITFTSLAFGIIHLTMYQVLYAFILGVFLSLAVYYTKSIWSSVIIHAVCNSVSVAITLLQPWIEKLTGGAQSSLPDMGNNAVMLMFSIMVWAILGVILLTLGALCMFWLKRVSDKRNAVKYGAEKNTVKEKITAGEWFIMAGVLFIGAIMLLLNFLGG